jgi:hypothetical protein
MYVQESVSMTTTRRQDQTRRGKRRGEEREPKTEEIGRERESREIGGSCRDLK